MQDELNKFAQETDHIVRDKLTEVFSSVIKIVIITVTIILLTIIVNFGILAYSIMDSNKNTNTIKNIEKIKYAEKIKKYNKKDYFIIPKNKMILIKTKRIKNKILKYYRYENNDTYFYITYYVK